MTFSIPTSDILTQASAFFNSLSGVVAVAIGIGLGAKVLYTVKSLF